MPSDSLFDRQKNVWHESTEEVPVKRQFIDSLQVKLEYRTYCFADKSSLYYEDVAKRVLK